MIGRRDWLKALAALPLAGWLHPWGPLVRAMPAEPIDALPYYRRAFTLLGELTEADRGLITRWKTVPLDEAVDGLLRRSARALADLGRGASFGDCLWPEVVRSADLGGGDRDVGKLQVSKIALLRARKLAATGRTWEALDDIFVAARFGRIIGRRGLLIHRVFQFSVENEAIAALAEMLPLLGPRGLASIPIRIANMPEPCSWSETMRREAGFIASTVVEALEDCPDPLDVESLEEILWGESERLALIEGTGGDRGRILELAEAIVPHVEGLAPILELPRGPFEAALATMRDRPGGCNLFASSVVDSAREIRFAADRTGVLWTMIGAALTLIVAGPDRFRAIADPFGDGPFGLVEFDGGFELRSGLEAAGRPPAIVRVGSGPA